MQSGISRGAWGLGSNDDKGGGNGRVLIGLKIEDKRVYVRGGQSLYQWVCLLLFYVLATSMILSRRAPTYLNRHSWRFHSAAPPGKQVANTITSYP